MMKGYVNDAGLGTITFPHSNLVDNPTCGFGMVSHIVFPYGIIRYIYHLCRSKRNIAGKEACSNAYPYRIGLRFASQLGARRAAAWMQG